MKSIKKPSNTKDSNNIQLSNRYLQKSAIYGLAVGDALGVPYEASIRNTINCTGMKGYGRHHQPPGTWPDDTALTLATLDAITTFLGVRRFDLKKLKNNFIHWREFGKFSIDNNTFDIGISTKKAINKMVMGYPLEECGNNTEGSKGNGSLMRMIPVAFYLKSEKDYEKRKELCYFMSSITHATDDCKIACHFYVELVIKIVDEIQKNQNNNDINVERLINETTEEMKDELMMNRVESEKEKSPFERIINHSLSKLTREEIRSHGYVIDTLEATLWCILKNDNYKDTMLCAVNLGHDTDTVAAVAGGIAGILYGYEGIPQEWINQLRGKKIIDSLL